MKNIVLIATFFTVFPPSIATLHARDYGYYQQPDFGRISRLMTQELDALVEPFKQKSAVRLRFTTYKEQQVESALQQLKQEASYLSVAEVERKAIELARSITYEFIKNEIQQLLQEELAYAHAPYTMRSQIIIMVNDEIEADFFSRMSNNQRLTTLLQELPRRIAQRVKQLISILA